MEFLWDDSDDEVEESDAGLEVSVDFSCEGMVVVKLLAVREGGFEVLPALSEGIHSCGVEWTTRRKEKKERNNGV